ncbi:MAG: hypothetical protein HQL44_05590 [Alphaproteobacteria bacterium]|nr:hypothetical protein [Alphaproteobacteria bacterium]
MNIDHGLFTPLTLARSLNRTFKKPTLHRKENTDDACLDCSSGNKFATDGGSQKAFSMQWVWGGATFWPAFTLCGNAIVIKEKSVNINLQFIFTILSCLYLRR